MLDEQFLKAVFNKTQLLILLNRTEKLPLAMKIQLKLLLTACSLSILAACGNNTSSNSEDIGKSAALTASPLGNAPAALTMAVDAYRPPASAAAQESPMKPRDMSAAPVATSISLGTPLTSQAAAANKYNATAANDHMGKPLKIGFNREVAQTKNTAATQQMLKWKTTATGGQVAAINFNSTGAKGIRIGLLITQLPETATLRFYAKSAETAFEVKAAEVLKVLATNLASGDNTDAGRTYWGPVIKSADATFEIELPAGVGTDTVQLSIPSVSHMFMSMNDAQAATAQTTYDGNNPDRTGNDYRSLSCQVDVVSCTGPLPAASDAVALVVFNLPDGPHSCSGTMLNNSLSDSKPYLLTANHCISSQTVASTLYTEFKYRSLACNNPTTGEYYPTASTGAALLYTATNTDSTLVRLYGTPSTSVLFAGWDASTTPAISTVIHNIHHPYGDQQRLSRGSVLEFRGSIASNFPEATAANGTFLGVILTTGLTQEGSSGSGLFKGADTNPQLIGQLYGGTTPACKVAGGPDVFAYNVYGRFDVAYKAGMSTWLSPTAAAPNPNRQPVYRFFNTQTKVYFYTIYATERDRILATLSDALVYEGIAFYASPSAVSGYNPIYRFRNTVTGAYLYTISVTEYNSILQNYPQFLPEGIAWYAESTSAGGGTPLYRFRTTNSTHIYTAYESERLSILANYPSFVPEGISYYIRQTP